MMKLIAAPLRAFAIPALALLALGACDRSPTENEEHTLGEVRLFDFDSDPNGAVLLATWTEDGGWDRQSLPISLSGGGRLWLGVRMFAEDGDERVLDGVEYSARWELAQGATTGVLVTDDSAGQRFLGNSVRIFAAALGTTRVQFLLWDVNHADGATDPIQITVVP